MLVNRYIRGIEYVIFSVKMPQYESIRIYPKTKNAISQLAKKWELTQVNFLESAMEYFKKTGVNPLDDKVLSPAEELKKFRDTIISFMRKQEKDYILPVFGNMEALIARFMRYIEEEAPRKTNPVPIGDLISQTREELKQKKNENPGKEISNPEVQTDDQYLLNELERERKKLNTVREYFGKILSSIEVKSTGLTKKPVIELPMAEINSMKEFVNRL